MRTEGIPSTDAELRPGPHLPAGGEHSGNRSPEKAGDSPDGRFPTPREPKAGHPRRLPALATSTLLQLVLLAGIFASNFIAGTDPDLFWHLSAGRYMVETASVPRVDPFSYTAAGQPWVAHEWLAEILMYLLYRAGGYLAPVLVFATTITLAFGFTLRTLRLLGLKPVAAFCIVVWVAAMSLFSWNVRPQAFSYLLFALYLFLLLRARVRRDRWIWLLPVLMIPWTNLHAGYVMGLVLMGLFLAGEAINRWTRGPHPRPLPATGRGDGASTEDSGMSTQDRAGGTPALPAAPSTQDRAGGTPALPAASSTQDRAGGTPALPAASSTQDRAGGTPALPAALSTQHSSLRRYLAVAAATVAATALNPQGPAILLYPLLYAGTQNASMQYISEWQSPNFHNYYFFIFGLSLMVLMVASRRPMDWALGLLVLVLTAMTLQSVRVIPFYALGVAPFLALRLGLTPPAGEPREGRDMAIRRSPARRWNWLVLALSLAVLVSAVFLSGHTQVGSEPHTTNYPAAGVRYLQESGLQGNLFNTYHWGGFIIWSFYPERRTFIDGRPDMYGDQFMAEYQKVDHAEPGWREVLDRHQVTVALLEKDGPTATLLRASGEWREVFQGEIESVLVREPPR